MNLRPHWIFLFAVVVSLSRPAGAQQLTSPAPSGNYEVDLAITYTEQYSNLVSTPTFWHGGGGAEFSAQVYRGWGLAANIAGTETPKAADSGVGLTMVTANFGPRYTFYRPLRSERDRSIAIFGQALGGLAWGFNSYFPSASGVQTDAVVFDFQLGGGVDLGLSRHFGVRVVQADWVRTEFPNGTTDVQNNLRLAAGIVLRIPQRK